MPEMIDRDKLAALVKKYDRPGPRYTSYPTAPEWSKEYGPEDYEKALKAASVNSGEPLSFYLHIPFCIRRCWFCGCNTLVSRNPDSADSYLARVNREVEMVKTLLGERQYVTQLHWGGGTPCFLTDRQTEQTFEIFARRFSIDKNAEISIELDPRVTTRPRIRLLQSLGFNRLSFGVQDFSAEVQEAIGRDQDETETIDLYHYCRDQGFAGINFDLVYGLPKQTTDGFSRTIKKTIELRPDRIALYSYAHLPEGKAHQKKIDETALPSAPVKSRMFAMASGLFMENCYIQIGMDHFVLPTDELARAAQRGKLRRNFMGYTVVSTRDWIGVGMSSISYINDNFAQNDGGLDSYNRAIDSGTPATYRGMKLTPDDIIRQYIISELMCNFRLELNELEKRFGIEAEQYLSDELEQLQPFLDDGLLIIEGGKLTITYIGKYFVRNIAMTFDAYLKKSHQKDSKVQYSRTA